MVDWNKFDKLLQDMGQNFNELFSSVDGKTVTKRTVTITDADGNTTTTTDGDERITELQAITTVLTEGQKMELQMLLKRKWGG